MAKILITGGAGFIGSALAYRLKKNHEVHLLDREDNFKKKPFLGVFPEHYADVRQHLLLDQEFDFIFHLAAQTSGRISQEEPYLDLDTNIKGTFNICNYARYCKAKKIIYISSMAVYGEQQGPLEEERPLIPVSNYGASKASGELFVKMYEQFGIKNTIFRPFNVYGPGQDMTNLKQGMASIFMAQSILGDQIKVTGSLDRYRDFIYIDDVVEALVLGIEPRSDGEIYNVGCGAKTTVRELVDLILKVNEKPSSSFTVTEENSHEGDQFGSISDNSKLKNLGWEDSIKLEEGLNKMYESVKKFTVPSFLSCTR